MEEGILLMDYLQKELVKVKQVLAQVMLQVNRLDLEIKALERIIESKGREGSDKSEVDRQAL